MARAKMTEENKSRKTAALVLVIFLLASVVFVSGCLSQNPVKSQDDVGRVVTNISTNVENVGSTLEDIDRGLSGTG